MRRDASLDTLLDLDGQVLFVDPEGHHWVRFVVQRVPVTGGKPHGLDYSLTLHGPDGESLVGFDNAHPVRRTSSPGGKAGTTFDHRHRLKAVRPYEYQDAAALLPDFWAAVDSAPPQRSDSMKTLKIGIASYEEMKERTRAIARGEIWAKTGEPTVWFTSTESFAKVLSNKNRALLEVIAKSRPSSLQELAKRTGRKPSNLSRTLKTMEHYGFVRLHRGERGRIRPEVPYRSISLDLSLTA